MHELLISQVLLHCVKKRLLCPCCSPSTTHSHRYYSPPCMSMGCELCLGNGCTVRCDTHSPLLLYMLWKCEHRSVVVVCLALGLACPSILSLHIEHRSMSSTATLQNEHVCQLCVYYLPLIGHLSQRSDPCKISNPPPSSFEVPEEQLSYCNFRVGLAVSHY